MNKFKLISIAALCALTLGACVDDKESASVTALRDAKTTYLKAQADYQNAQAEVAKINAEVAKAKAQAEAEVEKLRVEAEVIRLKAEAAVSEAEAEKFKAEAAKVQQQAANAAKRFEIQLAELQAQAKMNAAKYEADYQTYVNALEKSKRQAELNMRADIVSLINDYSSSLGSIRQFEGSVNSQTLALADYQQRKLNALAGTALAQAKNDVITKEAKIAGDKVALQDLLLLQKSDADKQKALVEELRAGLSAKAEKAQAAKDKFQAIGSSVKDLEGECDVLDKILNGVVIYDPYSRKILDGKIDSLKEAWYVLGDAEYTTHGRSLSIPYSLAGFKSFQYYTWEFDKLLVDMNSNLEVLQTDLTTMDTLAVATESLEKLFTAVKKAEGTHIEAEADLVLKEKALQVAINSGDAIKIAKARIALEKAAEVVNGVFADGVYVGGTAWELSEIKDIYEQKRRDNGILNDQIDEQKGIVETEILAMKAVEAAKLICFGTMLQECFDLDAQISEKSKEIGELQTSYAKAKVQHEIILRDYTSDKDIVRLWDNGQDFQAQIEVKINTQEGAVATMEKELEQLKALIADPDQTKFAEKYCNELNIGIATAEKMLAEAKAQLEEYKALADSQKAQLDAWQAELAE